MSFKNIFKNNKLRNEAKAEQDRENQEAKAEQDRKNQEAKAEQDRKNQEAKDKTKNTESSSDNLEEILRRKIENRKNRDKQKEKKQQEMKDKSASDEDLYRFTKEKFYNKEDLSNPMACQKDLNIENILYKVSVIGEGSKSMFFDPNNLDIFYTVCKGLYNQSRMCKHDIPTKSLKFMDLYPNCFKDNNFICGNNGTSDDDNIHTEFYAGSHTINPCTEF